MSLPLVTSSGSGDFIKLDEINLLAPSPTIDFLAIPVGYRSLYIVLQGRLTVAATDAFVGVQLNGDVGANYNTQYLYATGGSVSPASLSGQTSGLIGLMTGANGPADSAGIAIIDIPFYAETVFQKTLRSSIADEFGATNLIVGDFVTRWLSTVAINQITFLLASGSFDTGSQATLYGLR